MEKLFYTVKDVAEMLGYSKNKTYSIIKKLNIELQEEAKLNNKNIVVFPGRIEKNFFEKKVGIKMED